MGTFPVVITQGGYSIHSFTGSFLAKQATWFRLVAPDQIQEGGSVVKSVGSYEAKTHLPRLLGQVEKGETITITRRGKPIAVLSPAEVQPRRDMRTVIDEFREYSRQRSRELGSLTPREILEMTEEGRP
jgi:prevent-host-death family protein